jgi:hypothetical protein
MYKCITVLISLLIISDTNLYSQDSETSFLNIEFEIGAGYAKSVNRNVFNDQQGVALGGGGAFNLAFRYHLDYNWSVGLHLILTADAISKYDSEAVLGFVSENNLTTTNVNLGFNGKYTFNLNRLQPFLIGGLGVALGGMDSADFEEPVNEFTGIALDMGIGLGYMTSNHVMISTSLIRNYGLAWWKYEPSYDSINKQFNPGFWSLMLNVSIFFGSDDLY